MPPPWLEQPPRWDLHIQPCIATLGLSSTDHHQPGQRCCGLQSTARREHGT